jgi:hypothetical protein
MQSVKVLATLHVDLSDVLKKDMKQRKSFSGKTYYTIRYDIEMSIQASIEFSLVIKGKTYGSITADYH